MSKRLSWLLVGVLCLGLVAGCGGPSVNDQPPAGTGANNGPMNGPMSGVMNGPPGPGSGGGGR